MAYIEVWFFSNWLSFVVITLTTQKCQKCINSGCCCLLHNYYTHSFFLGSKILCWFVAICSPVTIATTPSSASFNRWTFTLQGRQLVLGQNFLTNIFECFLVSQCRLYTGLLVTYRKQYIFKSFCGWNSDTLEIFAN